MACITLVSRLLDAADCLLNEQPRSAAFRRRAVSTAYYAVFHAIAKVCADYLAPNVSRGSDEYARIYRALEHSSLKSAFGKAPLRERESLRKIGDLVVPLQSERHQADYLPPLRDLFPRQKVRKLIDQAREAVEYIHDLNPEDRLALAAHLLFRTRQQ